MRPTSVYIIRSNSDKTMAHCLYEVSLAEIKLFLLFTNTINVNISELMAPKYTAEFVASKLGGWLNYKIIKSVNSFVCLSTFTVCCR